ILVLSVKNETEVGMEIYSGRLAVPRKTLASHSMENTSFIIANFSPGFSPVTGSNSFPISSCHFRLVGSLSSERHAASKSSTCMIRNKSCSLLKMEYLETPTSFNLDSKAGQTFRCAASYSASLPAFIRNRKATLGTGPPCFPNPDASREARIPGLWEGKHADGKTVDHQLVRS